MDLVDNGATRPLSKPLGETGRCTGGSLSDDSDDSDDDDASVAPHGDAALHCRGATATEAHSRIAANVALYLRRAHARVGAAQLCPRALDPSPACLCHLSEKSPPSPPTANQCAGLLRAYKAYLGKLGVVFADVRTGALERVVANCCTFAHNGLAALHRKPEHHALHCDLLLLALARHDFGNYALELFDFFARHQHELPAAFRAHWMHERTVHIVALLAHLRPSTFGAALAARRGAPDAHAASRASQQVFVLHNALNALFTASADGGGGDDSACIEAVAASRASSESAALPISATVTTTTTTTKPPAAPGRRTSARQPAASVCSCGMPTVRVQMRTVAPTPPSPTTAVVHTAKMRYRTQMARRAAAANKRRKIVLADEVDALSRHIARTQRAEQAKVVHSALQWHADDGGVDNADDEFPPRSPFAGGAAVAAAAAAIDAAAAAAAPAASGGNWCYDTCVFWRDGVLRCGTHAASKV